MMDVYIVENVYGKEPIYTRDIIGVYDHISKAAWTVWELLNQMFGDKPIEDDAMSVNDIVKSGGANYKRADGFKGELKITKYTVL